MEPFFASQLFDREGYYTTLIASSVEELRAAVAKRTAALKGLIACSLPFEGAWRGRTPDVTLPPEYKTELAVIDHSIKDE